MIGQTIKVVVAAPTFGTPILIALCDQLRKLFKPEEMARRSITGEADIQKERLDKILRQEHATALIALDIRPDQEIISTFKTAGVPIILVDEEAAGVSTVSTNNYMGGRIAAEFLIKKGKKRNAIVSGRTQVLGGYNAELRLKGFKDALHDAKLTMPQGFIVEIQNYTREEGVEVMPGLLRLGADAVFSAAGDNCALGLLSVAKELGKKIPEDVAIIGFDDLFLARTSTPSLTTIRQPLEKIAEAAYQMAVNEREKIVNSPRKAIFDPELVIRNSA